MSPNKQSKKRSQKKSVVRDLAPKRDPKAGFTGSIPTQLGQLSGNIPTQLGN